MFFFSGFLFILCMSLEFALLVYSIHNAHIVIRKNDGNIPKCLPGCATKGSHAQLYNTDMAYLIFNYLTFTIKAIK